MSKMIKIFRIVLLALMAFIFVVVPVLAIGYTATFTVNNTSATSYTMLGVSQTMDNAYLASNGFISASGLDTRIEEASGTAKPHMIASDRTLTAIACPTTSQTNLSYTTGNTALTAFDIIVGDGGYVTTADAAALEFGNNFSSEISGYIDTSASGTLLSKADAFETLTYPIGSVTSNIISGTVTGGSPSSQTAVSASTPLYNGSNTRAGFRYDGFYGYITAVDFQLYKTGSPTGTVSCTVRNAGTDALIGTLGTIVASTLTGVPTFYTFNNTQVNAYNINIRVSIEYSGGSGANYVTVSNNAGAGDVKPVYIRTRYNGSWTDDATTDSTWQNFTFTNPKAVSVTSVVASGEHIVKTYISGTDLKLDIDGVNVATTALGGASVPDNANNWIFYSDPYWNYYSHTVGGTLVVHYHPATIISSAGATATLPDLEGAAQNGTITWGSNPADVTVTLGSLVSDAQAAAVPTETPSTEILPDVTVSDWYKEPAVATSLLTNPFRPFVTLLSDTTTLTEIQSWRFLGLVFVLFVTVACVVSVKSHLLVAGIGGAGSIGILVAMTVWPLWTLIFAIGAILAGLISERNPSI